MSGYNIIMIMWCYYDKFNLIVMNFFGELAVDVEFHKWTMDLIKIFRVVICDSYPISLNSVLPVIDHLINLHV